jgi:hypothetical protein
VPRLTTAVTVAVAAAVGSTGLAVPAAAAAGGKPPAPCSLLTEKQAAHLLGEPVEDGRSERISGARQCQWQAREAGTGGIEGSTLGLTVVVHTSKRARRDFDEFVRDQDNEIIDGIGDEAVADDTFAVPVAVRVGRRIFEVGVNNYDTSEWDGDPGAIATDGAEIVATSSPGAATSRRRSSSPARSWRASPTTSRFRHPSATGRRSARSTTAAAPSAVISPSTRS